MVSDHDPTPAIPPARVAQTALLAALATIHASRRGSVERFSVGESPEILTRAQAIRALDLLPKPLLLHCAVRGDGTVRLYAPQTVLAQQMHSDLAERAHEELAEWQSSWNRHYGERADSVRIMVQAAEEPLLLSRRELDEFVRDYHFWRGGYAIDDADAAARALGADLVLKF